MFSGLSSNLWVNQVSRKTHDLVNKSAKKTTKFRKESQMQNVKSAQPILGNRRWTSANVNTLSVTWCQTRSQRLSLHLLFSMPAWDQSSFCALVLYGSTTKGRLFPAMPLSILPVSQLFGCRQDLIGPNTIACSVPFCS